MHAFEELPAHFDAELARLAAAGRIDIAHVRRRLLWLLGRRGQREGQEGRKHKDL